MSEPSLNADSVGRYDGPEGQRLLAWERGLVRAIDLEHKALDLLAERHPEELQEIKRRLLDQKRTELTAEDFEALVAHIPRDVIGGNE